MKNEYRKQTKLWKTKDGTKIRICDMTDQHLKNTIAMLENRAIAKKNEIEWLALHMEDKTHGDMATLMAQHAVDEAFNTPHTEYLDDIYWNMVDELERRESLFCDKMYDKIRINYRRF